MAFYGVQAASGSSAWTAHLYSNTMHIIIDHMTTFGHGRHAHSGMFGNRVHWPLGACVPMYANPLVSERVSGVKHYLHYLSL